jgi:hypothetical protein
MTLTDLDNVIKQNMPHDPSNYSIWVWHLFLDSKLAKYFRSRNKELFNSAHEGLLFTNKCIKKMVDFLLSDEDMRKELFNLEGQVEEFAFQSISTGLDDNFYYIGNGCCINEKVKSNSENDRLLFMYKIDRIENFRGNKNLIFVYSI